MGKNGVRDQVSNSGRGRHGNHRSGPNHPRWNGGKLLLSNGYVAVRVAHDHPHAWGPKTGLFRYAYEHILVMEKHVGRPILTSEIVHHKNGDKTDNRPDNLELMTRSEHNAEHNKIRLRDANGRFVSKWREQLKVSR